MKLITKNTDYAIRALLKLAAGRGLFQSAKDISRGQGIPYPFLRRILTMLIASRLVVSKEGTGGGYALAVSADTIRIIDVIRIFQGELCLSECLFRRKICRNRPACVLRHEITRIETMVRREFAGLTIGKLLWETMKP
jgi:Rrf2 family transcriptional regulator, cysteine metabolism repressor